MPVPVTLPKKPEDLLQEVQQYQADRLIQNITFFGDSAIEEEDPIYKSVWEAAKLLAQNGYSIVNGGGPGVMQAATDGAESVNGNTVAVYWEPKLASIFEGKNLSNLTDESATYSNYMMRTLGLIEKGHVYVVCKGGTGTISELGMVWALAKLYYGKHKPVILYGDFWDELIIAFQKTMNIDEQELGVLYNATNPSELFSMINLMEAEVQHRKARNFEGDEMAFVLNPKVKKTMESYNKYGKKYHDVRAGKLVAEDQLNEFISMINPPAQVLDVGCGPGYDTKYLSEKFTVTGIDVSKKMVDIATFENPNADIIHADIRNYDLPMNKYKGVWARDSLHHIPEDDLDIVFKKLADSLVDEGVLYVIVREGEGEFLDKEKKDYGTLERFYHLFSTEELTERTKKAGLKLIKIDKKKRSHKWLVGVFQK